MAQIHFLSDETARAAREDFGTPVYLYDQHSLEDAAAAALSFPNAYGLTARYAMKALPTAAILRILTTAGLHIDASSGFEAERALAAGIAPDRILITAQEMPANLEQLVKSGVEFNACSLHQLRTFGEIFPASEISVRVNPGLGSGENNRTNVGGPAASFGIWHELLDEVEIIRAEHGLKITAMHTHIGSGSDPEIWKRCARLSLGIAARLHDVRRLNLGGGFKTGRMPGEASADLHEIGNALLPDFQNFAKEHGRELHLEIEPGTFIAANAGAIVATVIDVVSTGRHGYDFIKLDTGLTEILRPSMYGAQQPMTLVPAEDGGEERAPHDYIVVGHCCESGDILTPAPGDPEALLPRTLVDAKIGDLLVIGGAGAYCAAMPAKNYNSFPEAPEVLITNDGIQVLIRSRQTAQQMTQNELEC